MPWKTQFLSSRRTVELLHKYESRRQYTVKQLIVSLGGGGDDDNDNIMNVSSLYIIR